MNEATEKRAANDVYDDLSLKLGHIAALLDVMANCDKDQCDANKAAYGLSYMVKVIGTAWDISDTDVPIVQNFGLRSDRPPYHDPDNS